MSDAMQNLLNNLPPIIARHDIEKYLGGLISKGYLQNLDCEGKGPERIKVGRKVGYTREALVTWLIQRTK